jgi:hypothetical protein
LLASGLPVREAVRQVVRQTGRSRNELYALALKIQEQA